MNAVEIEEAVSALAEAPFDAEEFPYQFLAAFGNKATTVKRLRTGNTNKSDVAGGVLQRSNIHIAVCDPGTVVATLPALRESPATLSQKAKYILATDGETVEAESMEDGETLACSYADLANHFGFFLTLAGITTVKQIRENAFDIKATSRLNKLYVELLKENPDWEDQREELNHFFARLIFCFFAEDTNIFQSDDQFTGAIEKMAASDSSNTHEVIAELFRAMNTKQDDRQSANIKRWASEFPYVNGGLFSGSLDVPRFSKIARSYLIHIGHLDWTKINPDIFGSMIQAVAEDEERGELGMHYTSVPNILKVLNPLFLDDLKDKLEEAGDGSDQGSKRKLLNLRNRMARIRVFDPACGSGNFLVIAYKEMRAIEVEINGRRGETDRRSDIPLTNFRGIELRHFAAEIARLALIIAEYQCDVIYRGPKLALAEFLPLEAANWIAHGNALRLDWKSICPSNGIGVKLQSDDLFETPLDQAKMDFENKGGETYICGNPPYKGNADQSREQKDDLRECLSAHFSKWRSLDYICGWFFKSHQYCQAVSGRYALVSTNSICQGQNIAYFWKPMHNLGAAIHFAVTSFRWSNLAANKAGVSVVVIGGGSGTPTTKKLIDEFDNRVVPHINAYLVPSDDVWVEKRSSPISVVSEMIKGNYYGLSDGLLLSRKQMKELVQAGVSEELIRVFKGAQELIDAKPRYCLWFEGNAEYERSKAVPQVEERVEANKQKRLASPDPMAHRMAAQPHQFREMRCATDHSIAVPVVSSENREYMPVTLEASNVVFSNGAFALYDAPLWNLALVASRMHIAWVSTVCGKLETRFRYSNTLGWNTFPVPPLTEQNRVELTRCAESILIARESYLPATIADMYDSDVMDNAYPELRVAHEANDETLERIYIGRRFKNDTERLETLFKLYTKMISKAGGK